MATLVLLITLGLGGVYLAVLIWGLEHGKSWAREITLTIALMEPSRGYMDYSYLRSRPDEGERLLDVESASESGVSNEEFPPEPPNRIAA